MMTSRMVANAPALARSVRVAAAALLGLLLMGWLLPANALPPGGASSDTAGTSGSVSPSTLAAGAVIKFSVSGFPAGETISVKIDDGEFCSDKSVHGACVVHQQRIDSSGRVSGSFALPADLGPGDHWLRFLASEELLDSDGRYVGVKPYSLRGNANFTVVAAGREAKTGTKPGNAADDEASPGQSQGAGAGAGASTPDLEGPADDAGQRADDRSSLRLPAPPASAGEAKPEVAAESGADEVDAQTRLSSADADTGTDTAAESRFPYVGAGALLVALVASVLLALRGRTGRARPPA